MRIAVFTESYEPIVNGVSVSVATLRDALRSKGHDVQIFAPEFAGYIDNDGVHRFSARATPFAPGYPIPRPYAPNAKKLFYDMNPDIVHTHTPFILGCAGLRWGKEKGLAVVSTNHTLYTEYTHYVPVVPRGMTRSFLVWWLKRYYNKCDAVVVPSKPVESVLRGFGVKSPIEIIKSGVTAVRVEARQEVRRTFDIPEGAFLLLYVGRVAKEKNLGLLLRSFKLIHNRYPNARLMIVGSGPYEQTCKNEARRLGVQPFIQFPGMLDRNLVSKIYSAADAFAFPSVTETQGLVVCEALSAGLPCVAVRAAGTPEVVQDGVDGILTGNSEREFTRAASRLIEDTELRDRLAQGGLRNAGRFSTEAMGEHFEKLYESALRCNADARCGEIGG